MIAVFLGNKLVSCDTVLPIMMTVKRRHPGEAINIYCIGRATFDVIHRNQVLWDGIHKIGRLYNLGRVGHGRGSWLVHRAKAFAFLLRLSWLGLIGRATFVHFGRLNAWPFRLLFFSNPRNTVLMQQVSAGHGPLEAGIDALKRARRDRTSDQAAGRLMGFGPNWPAFAQAGVPQSRCHVLGVPHLAPAWRDYIDGRAARDFDGAGHGESAEILAFMLGFFGPLDFLPSADTVQQLFEESLDILVAAGGGRPVFIKPHAITDLKIVDTALKARAGAPLVVSHLHPNVLATRARLCIANYYSATLYTMRALGVPTIEYTDYTEQALVATDDGSMRPDAVSHFVQRDRAGLDRLVRDLVQRPRNHIAPRDLDPSAIDALARRPYPRGTGSVRGADLEHMVTKP